MSETFGPTALATPANALTLGRLVAAPLLMLAIIASGKPSWFLVAVWFVAAGSDGVDGWLARRQGTTRSGAFLDPLADKFLVLSSLVGLAVIHEVSWIPIIVIGLREVAMSVYRSYAGRRGVSIPARTTAKLKTAAQDLAVMLAFLPPVGTHHLAVVSWVLWVAVFLTVFTGLEYLHDGRKLLATAIQPASQVPPQVPSV